MNLTRRAIFTTTMAALVTTCWPRLPAAAAAEELTVPDNVPADTFDFEAKGIDGWTTVDGQWAVEDMAGAPSGKNVLVQRATRNEFNVIVAPPGPYTDVDVTMRFKPISGREDASGGIVFRFNDGKYYVVRANALEGNFRRAADHTHSLAGSSPILALDMYEHSYHMDYGAAAAKYVDAFMDNINWTNVSRLHQEHAR